MAIADAQDAAVLQEATMLLTRIFSDRPFTPGRRQQMPRMIRSIWTPACDASYSLSMMSGSTREFSLTQIAALRPARACSISRSINWTIRGRIISGAIASFSRCCGLAYPVM